MDIKSEAIVDRDFEFDINFCKGTIFGPNVPFENWTSRKDEKLYFQGSMVYVSSIQRWEKFGGNFFSRCWYKR